MDNRIVAYFEGELNLKERLNLLNEIEANELLKAKFISYRNSLGLLALSAKLADESEGQESYQQFAYKQKQHSSKKKFLQLMRYTASAAVLIIGTFLLTSELIKPKVNISSNTIYAPAGQRTDLILSDGTEVCLNANSTIVYPSMFGDGERRIKLTGEAFFKVAKDAKKPFIVETDQLKVKVLGTTFNVTSYSDEGQTSVSLLEGSVKVSSENEERILKPNEQVVYSNGKMLVTNFQNENGFSWTRGVYTFENTPLSDILRKMELYYDVKITVKNTSVFDVLYTGKFRQRDGVLEILKILQKVHPFTIKKDEENNVITIE